jgi:ribosomal protein S18 acetylase RimI-like enzyme
VPRVNLAPMVPDDYARFLTLAAETYAGGAERSGEMTYAQARVRAQQDLEALLPNALETPSMLFRTLRVDAELAGHIWLGVRGADGGRYGWVWDIYVDPQHRGRGYGAEAMRLAEDEARAVFGITELRLNVFATNQAAVRLYDRLGYVVTSQVMRKAVG